MRRKLWRFSLVLLALAWSFGFRDVYAKPPRLWRGIDVQGMDQSIKPWNDFYRYANGKWIAETDLPADRPSLFLFTLLQDHNRKILRQILEESGEGETGILNDVGKKVRAFYRSGMDESSINAAGLKPLQKDLDAIAAISDRAAILPEIGRLQLHGASVAFEFASATDFKNSKRVIAEFTQGGLGLPDRDYYLSSTEKMKTIRAAYLDHVRKMFVLLGEGADQAAAHAKTVMALETQLAKASKTRVAMREPHANYHLLTVKEMEEETPGVSWKTYFQTLGLDSLKELNVGQPEFLKEIGRMAASTPLDDWKTYFRWHHINAYADSLSDPFVQEKFHFRGTVLQGVPRNRPRWERVVQDADQLLGEPLGRLYVKRAFSPEAKAKAEALVQNIKAALRERLAKLDWMSPDTRKHALHKLDAIAVKVGYPVQWRDYSGLAVDGDSYAANVKKGRLFQKRFDLAKIGKPVDRNEWQMSPPTVNAYYSPTENEIVFPAGILQPPFFDPKADDAVNYGAIGMVIGHELTHGFDDQGRQFDAEGNLREWWTPQDERTYKERAAQISRQYDGYVAVDDLKINGQLTLGENIADLGGLKIAFIAFEKSLQGKPQPPKIDGFTAEQRFFLAFAQGWRGLTRPEVLRMRLVTDPHSPARFRVLGPLYNMPEFFQAFDVPRDQVDKRLNQKPTEIW